MCETGEMSDNFAFPLYVYIKLLYNSSCLTNFKAKEQSYATIAYANARALAKTRHKKVKIPRRHKWLKLI